VATWEIILIVVVAVLILLAIGGSLARRRQFARTEDDFDAQLAQANRDLATAHAKDRGWQRSVLEDAARRAFAEQRSGAQPENMTLVAIIDRPGTDEDKAVFQLEEGGDRHELTLGRQNDQWVLERLD
jgi:hypothetical protein